MKNQKKKIAEPIAIVGMAFRFPGDLSDEQGLWEALKEGRDVVSQIGPERWATDELQHPKRGEPGRSITFSAGILSRVDEFDAAFFGISPREAAWLDPQQRMLLELAWEAMENSGQVPAHLAGSDCGVYVGIASLDYGVRGISDLGSISSHSMTGNTLSIAANRISYAFDLHGPSLSVDTACSSSLVALHQACSSLRTGESSVALVGSVNLLLHPYPFVGFTKASMISASGRCRAFDASADGYVRSEGGAVLVLKPLAQAEADGDPIHAVILASGANADGSRKTAITIPSSVGQAELMRSVLSSAGINSAQVDYVEAHGTGTAVGDPVEAHAIGEVYGRKRSAPLPIGSVKTNMGHLEAASGMAGLIKTIVMLKHQALPPSLHFSNPNPNIAFGDLNLEVVTEYAALPKRKEHPLVMGVNSFGFGGSNAHVLLQAYSKTAKTSKIAALSTPPLFLSARAPQALRETAARYAKLLTSSAPSAYYDIAYSAAYHRQHLEHRLALKAPDCASATHLLERFAQGENPPEIIVENLLPSPGSIAFIYSGNGAQWWGMGRRLLSEMPRFAELMNELDTAMLVPAGFSILEELHASETDSRLQDTAVAQPLLFAMQVALTQLLRQQGVEAPAVAGHSVGEVSAAWAAGALSLSQGIEVVCGRSAAQANAKGSGRMAAVGLSAEAIQAILTEDHYSTIEIAGINSPHNVSLAGSFAELEALRIKLEARNVFFRLLDLDYAFHSRAMDAIKQRLEEKLGVITPAKTKICFVSTVTGNVLEGRALSTSYWWDNVRKPVRFAQAIDTLIQQGCRVFLEIGPHAILQRYLTECLSAGKVTGQVLHTLRRKNDGIARLDEAILRTHMAVANPKLNAYFPIQGQFVTLPTYAWQRERYWLPKTSESYGLIERSRVHPLLGWRLMESEASWENILDPATYAYLAHHRVAGAIVFPASAYVEMALAAARECLSGECFELEELDILSPIVFDGEHAQTLRFELATRDGSFRILSRSRLSEEAWNINAVGRLLSAPVREAPIVAKDAIQGNPISASDHYHLAHNVGLEYGPAFQGVVSVVQNGDTIEGLLALPESAQENIDAYVLHPVLLDSCFQSLVHFFREDIEAGRGLPLLPVKIGRLYYFSKNPATSFRIHLTQRGARSVEAECVLLDGQGNVVCVLNACRFRAATVQRKGDAPPAQWHISAKLLPHRADLTPANITSNDLWAKEARDVLVDNERVLHRQAYYEEGLPLFNALVVAFAYSAFCEIDKSQPDWLQKTLHSPETLPAERRYFFQWITQCLEEALLLKHTGGRWYLDGADAPPAPEDIWRALLADFPDSFSELLFIGRIGRRLAGLLLGEEDIRSLSYTIEQSYFLEPMFDKALPYRGMYFALREMLANIANTWPDNRRLRILEISRGSSELSYQLAAHLPKDRTDYVIAEVENERLVRLKAEYKAHAFVTVATLGINDLSLTANTTVPEVFDVIIIQHWLHRAPDAAVTLALLRSKLAPGGQLILAERPATTAADFIFGLDPKWWREGEKAISSLLHPDFWASLLNAQGFSEIKTIIEPADEETRGGAYLLLARNLTSSIALAQPVHAKWLLLSDDVDAPSDLAERLVASGGHVVTARVERADACIVENLLKAKLQEAGRIDHIVYLPSAVAAIVQTSGTRSIAALHLVQAIAKGEFGQPHLWLVMAGGALATYPGKDWTICPQEASLWGLGRVIMNEYPQLSCKLIDVACDLQSPQVCERLYNELVAPDGESEIVIAPEARFGLRMQREDGNVREGADYAQRFRLDFQVPGQLRNLCWLPQAEPELRADEIEVRPLATGLNFRDVMYTMGLLPDEAVEKGFAGATLGLEFAGVVSRVGSAIREYNIGDEVMGFGSACFASHVVTKANAVTRKPASWSFAQAATVPTAFFTVYYALKYLAQLQPGERVLIHGGAGGVGIAAIQLAQHLGAEIFVTAGSDEKRDFVRLLGADHVLDSRSLAFADDILALTDNEGVDVVLNSLAGEAINRNLRVLKPFGRFLELGKRDFFENTHIGLRPFKNNISYFGIDADQLLSARPELAARLFHEVMELFHSSEFSALPHRTFPAERVVEAFRYMQQSHHIGKVVVELGDMRIPVANHQENRLPLRFDANATYLVTGGLEGFGLESACWFARHGAKHLVLISRRGQETQGCAQALARLEALGARAHIFACDVTDSARLEDVFTQIQSQLPPLKGILHAAMVLSDGLLASLDEAHFAKVLAPKLLGAWNLHQLSLTLPLDYFILYSSVTTSIGNPGQGNYVAANAYLESLAALRRSQDLPATCIGWGPIDDAGYLARNQGVKDGLAAKLGAKPLTVLQALSALEKLLVENVHSTIIANFDWSILARLLPSASGSRFETLRDLVGASELKEVTTKDIVLLIAGKSLEEVRPIVQNLIIAEVAKILCIGQERIDPLKSLSDIGMDSLMTVELALALEERFGLHLPAIGLSEGAGNIENISTRVAEKLLGAGQRASHDDSMVHLVGTVLAQHDTIISAEDISKTVAELKSQAQKEARFTA